MSCSPGRTPRWSDGTSPAEIVTYLILAVATLVTTNSVSSLLEIVMPGDGVLIAGADDLALSLSTLIVAGVVAVALWIAMERTTTDQADRLASFTWRSSTRCRWQFLRSASFGCCYGQSGRPTSSHRLWPTWPRSVRPGSSMSGSDGRPRNSTSFVSLPGLLIGLVTVDGRCVRGSSFELRRDRDFRPGHRRRRRPMGTDFGLGLVLLVVGVPFFWWFWLRGLAGRPGSWRNGYAVFVSIAAWLTGFTTAAVILNRLAQWARRARRAAACLHFDRFPPAPPSPSWPASFTGTTGPVLGQERNTADPNRRVFLLRGRARRRGRGGCDAGGDPRRQSLRGGSVVDSDSRVALGALVVLILSALTVWRYWVKALQLADDPSEKNVGPPPGDDPDSEGRLLPGGRRGPDRCSLRPAPGRPRRRCLGTSAKT